MSDFKGMFEDTEPDGYPKKEAFYRHGTFWGQGYDAAVREWQNRQTGMDLDYNGQLRDDDDSCDTSSYPSTTETVVEKPQKPKITPEIQKRIDAAKAEIQRRKQDNQWGGICIATKILVQNGHKADARMIIQEYLKAHQKGV